MPALRRAAATGRIAWLGHVPDRDAALASTPQDAMALPLEGPVGEAHGGATRLSCSRVIDLYPRDTEIRNARQLSVLSVEELAAIASALALDALDPAWLGATMVLEGIEDLSFLPPSSRLQFGGKGGATIVVDMNNRPCHLPSPVIDAARPGHGRAFKAAADGLRGVTAWVERAGEVAIGDPVAVFVPDQRLWRGA
jgi:hypothetical protein